MARKTSDYIQMLLDHGIDVPGRTIYMTSFGDGNAEEAGVDWQMADRVLKGLHLMSTGDQPIKLIINSFGGEDDQARAIIGAIKQCPVEVHGIVYGRAESAAAWVLSRCDKKYMDGHASIMLHMGAGIKDKHGKYIDNLFVEDVLAVLKAKNPDYNRSKLLKQLDNDWYIYPEEALELGLIDEILGD